MENFHEILLPTIYQVDSQAIIEFETSLIKTYSGGEYRYQRKSFGRHSFEIAYSLVAGNENDDTESQESIKALMNFWSARKGSLYGFWFKDFFDYQMSRTIIGQGDGIETDFQIQKKYTILTETYSRSIYCPTSVSVWVNSVLQNSGYTITDGKITFSAPPTSGHNVEASCDFYVPVRFEGRPAIKNLSWNAQSIEFKLKEIFNFETPITTTKTFEELTPVYWAGSGT